MNLSFIATLEAVLRTGSFAHAAVDRHLSRSAVSLQMRRLEEYFGQPLFDRSSQQARPTAFAQEVLATFAQAMHNAELLRQRDAHVIEGEVSLGVTESMQALVLPRILPLLKTRYPRLLIKPMRGRSQTLLEQVKRGDIDCAIVIQSPQGGARRLIWTQLLREPLVLAAPPDTPDAPVDELLRRHEIIRFDNRTNVGHASARYVASRGIRSQGDIELQSVPSILALVSSGLGVSIAFIPDRRICLSYPVRLFDLGLDGPFLQAAFVTLPQQAENRRV